MKELRKKLRAFLFFLSGELMVLGASSLFAALTPEIPLSETAKFLGCCVFMHLATAWIELRTWKKESQKMSGYLDAKI